MHLVSAVCSMSRDELLPTNMATVENSPTVTFKSPEYIRLQGIAVGVGADKPLVEMQFQFVLLCLLLPALRVLALPLNGADFSSLSLLESQGIHYTDNGAVKPFEQILSSHGFGLARIRVWTAGTYTQSYALNLARRAKSAGMKVLIDLHYSDTCAYIIFDPSAALK
jgi:hypothetical protein